MRSNILVLGCLLLAFSGYSQLVLSPYTVSGIGEINNMGVAQNDAMGGLGISYSNVWHINNQNPALLVGNSFSSFQMGIEADVRTISNEFTTDKSGTGNLKYLIFSFPIVKAKWTSSFGIMPYSSVSYNIVDEEVIPGSSTVATFNYLGNGGISQFYWSNGFKLFKGFSVGFRAAYVFGNIQNEIVSSISNENTFRTAYVENTSYNDFTFNSGLYYRKELKDKNYLNFGAIFDLRGNLVGERLGVLERRDFGNRVTPVDTVLNYEKSEFRLPQSYGFGITYEKLNKMAIGLDVHFQEWENGAGFENNNTDFNNVMRIALGGEYIPDATDVNSYFKRITYRAGLSYQTSPYLVGGNEIQDFGINFGWSIPVSRASTLDMAFKLGQRGTLSDNLVRERYFKFVIGATINDRWFVRRK
jgi:hypothetical protein